MFPCVKEDNIAGDKDATGVRQDEKYQRQETAVIRRPNFNVTTTNEA